MRTFKIIAALGALLLVASSCNMFVKRDALESSQAETREARKALQETQKNYALQNRELNEILGELTEISRQSTSLQLGEDENGGSRLTQAEKIDKRLSVLKDRIDRLEKDAERARKLDRNLAIATKTIATLRQTVETQQGEIDRLRSTLQEQEATIEAQEGVISEQKDTISLRESTIELQNQKLERTLRHQTELLFVAGQEFELLADQADSQLDVFGRKDKNKVKEFKKSLYSKAAEYYGAALEQGHEQAAQCLKLVTGKMKEF